MVPTIKLTWLSRTKSRVFKVGINFLTKYESQKSLYSQMNHFNKNYKTKRKSIHEHGLTSQV